MRIVTYNLRYDSMPDHISVQESINSLDDPLKQPRFLASSKEHPWSTRRLRIAELLLSEGIVLAGLQEVLVRQVNDLAELLGDEWSWIGVGRDDGVARGEFNPIFFNKSIITLISNDTFWLSDTPFKPSKFPGAGCARICTTACFKITARSSASVSKTFTILNTHLDNQSDHQRRLGSSLLLTRARYEAVKTNSPVFIMGDFNSTTHDLDAGAYHIIIGASPPLAIDPSFAAKYAVRNHQQPGFKMQDLRGHTPRQNVSTNFATFTGFTAPEDPSSWSRIDFIFGGSNMGWNVLRYTVGTSLGDDGVLASDHRPVFADVLI